MVINVKPLQPVWQKYTKQDNLWELRSRKLKIQIQSEALSGLLVYEIHVGYFTDFRSGSSYIDPVIPKIGDTRLMVAWLVHDINYHGFLSRKLSDTLLREMLEYSGMNIVKRNAVYYGVRVFGGSHYNTLDEDQGPIYNKNKTMVKFTWKPGKLRTSKSEFEKLKNAYPIILGE